MSKVLFIYEKEMPTVRLLQEKYCALSKCDVDFCALNKIDSKVIDSYDVLVLIRPSDIMSYGIAKKAKESGAFIIFYTDDDLIGLPASSPFSNVRKKMMKKIANVSSLVLAANPYICKKYSAFITNNRFSETITSVDYLNLDAINYKINEDHCGVTKIVYAAGNGHESVFYRFISPILKRLDLRFGKDIEFDLVGVHPKIDVSSYSFKINYTEGMSLDAYRVFMATQKYDIGIAPLEDTEFNKCKHYNKYLEYTASGIVGVYSNCEPYTNAVVNRWNGYLADNTEDGWYKAISDAVCSISERKELLKNAKNHILNNYNLESFEDKLYHDIPELITLNHERKACKSLTLDKISYLIFLIWDKLYLLLFYFRNEKSYIIKKMRSIFLQR